MDEKTGRGIPAVRLTTTNFVEYWTDSAGVVAFYEPDLMNQSVYFDVESHGYTFPKDGWFGFHGRILEIKPGGSTVLQMHRDNIAQRLYRMTGAGIYRDSILLGDPVPPVEEEGKSPIAGQDGADAILYGGKLYWFWGDTGIPRFPLGVFRSTCAVSDPPGRGGLDPEVGIVYTYLRAANGEPRPMINLPNGVYWPGAHRTVVGKDGREKLLADYVKIEKPMRGVEHGLVEFSEKTGYFELVHQYPEDNTIPVDSYTGPVFRYQEDGKDYFYYPAPYPCIRRPIDYESQLNLDTRQAFTCLKEGSRFDGTQGQLDRDKDGALRWGWKHNTSPIAEKEMAQLIRAKALRPDEQWYAVRDVNTGKPLLSHSGSVNWNAYRKRWVCIRCQNWGDTMVGEIWYLEGDTPQGPWVYATKIVTHAWKDHTVSFYSTGQIPDFDKNGGRTVFFKGSFSAEFGDFKMPAPRYNYNTILYKLELDDARLFLPVPVYRVAGTPPRYGTKDAFPDSETDRDIVWFAPDRPRTDTVPVYALEDAGHRAVTLTTHAASATGAKPIFYAVPTQADVPATSTLAQTVPLHEFVNPGDGQRVYTTQDSLDEKGFERSAAPICRVWPNPIWFNPYRK